ncbi:unnamed protein product [Spirodela intermedia]|uniref:Uncharacterized protein n=1 Tax=Spirodela intermedia TaxID=51605 RepID=A0A7I8IGN8_SPIIN|nr:unnamed protein product [Spirodela intermedia]CAA6656233.1 unnamed protein product [Spirodela intermedia]
MVGGWRAQTIVEAWSPGPEAVATSLGLAAAARHTRGRHVCVVPDERARSAYAEAMRAAAREQQERRGLGTRDGGRRRGGGGGDGEDPRSGLRGSGLAAEGLGEDPPLGAAGRPGAVLVCLGGSHRPSDCGGGGGGTARWRGMLMAGSRVVRSALLPIGGGVEVVHVGVGRGPSLGGNCSRWIKHVDRDTGEEHVFRR